MTEFLHFLSFSVILSLLLLFIITPMSSKATAAEEQRIISTIAGGGGVGDGLPPLMSGLNSPTDITGDERGLLFICDSGNNRIRVANLSGNDVRTFAAVLLEAGKVETLVGTGSAEFNGEGYLGVLISGGRPPTLPNVDDPRGIALSPDGSVLYIAERTRIRVINDSVYPSLTIAGLTVGVGETGTIAGTGEEGFNGDGLSIDSQVNRPDAIDVDLDGNVYFVDYGNDRVRVINPSTSERNIAGVLVPPGHVATIAGPEQDAAIPGTPGIWRRAGGLAVFHSRSDFGATVRRNIFFSVGPSVYCINAGSQAINFGNAIGLEPGQAAFARGLQGEPGISYLAIDRETESIFASSPDAVWKISPDETVAIYTGEKTDWDTRYYENPFLGLYYNSKSGYLYFANQNWISAVAPGGGVSSTPVVGNGFTGVSGDGALATMAHLNQPLGVAVDKKNGFVFVSDSGNNRVVKIDSETGKLHVLAGTGRAAVLGDGGPATEASLEFPRGVEFDDEGIVYVADFGRIRAINTGSVARARAGVAIGPGTITTLLEVICPTNISLRRFADPLLVILTCRKGIRGDFLYTKLNLVTGDSEDFSLIKGPYTKSGFSDIAAPFSSGGSYLIDIGNNVVYYKGSNALGDIVAGIWNQTEPFANGVTATSSALDSPKGLAFGRDAYESKLFISDSNHNQVRVVSSGIIDAFAGTGVAGYFGDGDVATEAFLNNPTDLAWVEQENEFGNNKLGDLYICDTGNNRIRLVPSAQTPSPTEMPTEAPISSPNNNTMSQAKMWRSKYTGFGALLAFLLQMIIW